MDSPKEREVTAEPTVVVPERVLVVESAEETAAVIREVLRDEGYEAPTVVRPADVVAEVRATSPDAVALNLPPDPARAGDVLDALRVDPVTRGVPLLATSTANQVVDGAPASYTVQATLRKPFDLDDLVAKVQRTLAEPPIQALVPDAAAEGLLTGAESVLAAGSREMLLRLAERLRSELRWDGQPPEAIGDALGDAPRIVDAVDASLRLPEPAALVEEHPAAAERLLAAAVERNAQGIDEADRAREVALLREELWALIARELPSDAGAKDVERLHRAIDGSLDRIVALTAPAFKTA